MTERTGASYLVEKDDSGEITHRVVEQSFAVLNDGDVLIEVSYSSLNYKDAMAAQGHPGIVKQFPHVPGIDAVGKVVESRHPDWKSGDVVIATGHELGVERWGGWSSLLISPGDWLVALPDGLSEVEVMSLGTAGFTAAQCVEALLRHGIDPEDGKIIVSGSTGGVGSLSVMVLGKLGYEIVAVTGKQEKADWLRSLGAAEVVGREALQPEKRPLLSGEFAAGIDTVGGTVLATMLKRIRHRGCVACCGVAGGGELQTTVYPFILRGLALYGIDSAWCPDDLRKEIWQKLASEWRLDNLNEIRVDMNLESVTAAVKKILAGHFAGRGVIEVPNSA